MIKNIDIFNITTQKEFEDVAFRIFKFQFENNTIYRSLCDLLYRSPSDVSAIEDIPFLPIQFFKSHKVVSHNHEANLIFESSATTGSITSKHYLTDVSIYEESFLKGFRSFYGDIENYTILALLPSYLERQNSSLVYMLNNLINKTKSPDSGFYLYNFLELKQTLEKLESSNKKVILLGVSFALLDFVEQYQFNLANTLVIETGGMKGRKKELIRNELHSILKVGFGVKTIHSEYGMTELLSQAYSTGNGIFNCPNWMQVFTREANDALTINNNKTGGLNIIDLANIHSCSFIATQDLGKVYRNGSFEVIGRFDNSDIRGCNLMAL